MLRKYMNTQKFKAQLMDHDPENDLWDNDEFVLTRIKTRWSFVIHCANHFMHHMIWHAVMQHWYGLKIWLIWEEETYYKRADRKLFQKTQFFGYCVHQLKPPLCEDVYSLCERGRAFKISLVKPTVVQHTIDLCVNFRFPDHSQVKKVTIRT